MNTAVGYLTNCSGLPEDSGTGVALFTAEHRGGARGVPVSEMSQSVDKTYGEGSPALIARTQRQQNIDHGRKTAARYVGRQHRRHDRIAGWSRL